MSRLYGSVWDARLILLQICTMQGIYYVGLCTFLLMLDFLFQRSITLNQIFSFKEVEFTIRGSVVIASFILNSLLW
jgi:hypothetical protein